VKYEHLSYRTEPPVRICRTNVKPKWFTSSFLIFINFFYHQTLCTSPVNWTCRMLFRHLASRYFVLMRVTNSLEFALTFQLHSVYWNHPHLTYIHKPQQPAAMCVCVCVRARACVYVSVCVSMHVCLYVCMCIYKCKVVVSEGFLSNIRP
jgi:hypothetical protein